MNQFHMLKDEVCHFLCDLISIVCDFISQVANWLSSGTSSELWHSMAATQETTPTLHQRNYQIGTYCT